MKIKVKMEKQLVTIKNLTAMQFSLIESLVSHVRLGDATEASSAAFEILQAIGQCEDLDFVETVEMEVGATTDGHTDGIEVWLDGPTLVACEPSDAEDDFGGPYYFAPAAAWPFDSPSSCSDCDECDC